MVRKEARPLHTYVAVYLLFRKEGKVLLLERTNTGYADGMFSLVAGHVEEDESAFVAACREAREEVGVAVSEDDLIPLTAVHRKAEDGRIYIDLFFECTHWEGEICNMEPSKSRQVIWVDPDRLPEALLPYVRDVIDLQIRGQLQAVIQKGF